jgi:predicted GIY-YIG superfamily endonuclease
MSDWRKFKDFISKQIEGIYKFDDNKTTKEKKYIGQSENVARRLKEHISDGKLDKADLENVEIKEVKGGKLAREIEEQKEIEANDGIVKKGRKLSNKRNPISKKRKKFLGLF